MVTADIKYLHGSAHELAAVLSSQGLAHLVSIHHNETASVIIALLKRKLRHGGPDCLFAFSILTCFLLAPQQKHKNFEVRLSHF
jgi:hypothetical protein